MACPHAFRPVAPVASTSLSYQQIDGRHPSWQCPHGTKSHAHANNEGPADGELLGCLEPLHSNGTCSPFGTPLTTSHSFRFVAPGLSTSNSFMQLEGGHPIWQYPHGTKSHVAQSSADGALLGSVDGTLLGTADSVPLGSADGALLGWVTTRHSSGH